MLGLSLFLFFTFIYFLFFTLTSRYICLLKAVLKRVKETDETWKEKSDVSLAIFRRTFCDPARNTSNGDVCS